MIGLIKAIKLQRRLRIRQEYTCFKVCQHSQNLLDGLSPFLNELSSLNKAVKKVNKKLPGIYFIISDLFGSLRKQCKEYIKNKEDPIKCPICKSSDNNTVFKKHHCNDCHNSWDCDISK